MATPRGPARWVSNQNVSATIQEDVLGTITAGVGYVVEPAGDVTFTAGESVRLLPEFSATSGSIVRARISAP